MVDVQIARFAAIGRTARVLVAWMLALAQVFGSGVAAAAGANSASAAAAKVAVVIGNSRYPSGALANPVNDATEMAASLRSLGFDVELKLDASKLDMDGVFKRFTQRVEKAKVAAVFYAGHGIQVAGANYIVPIDANPKSERDLKREMVKLDDVIDDMGEAQVKLVFFDACRDNPLSRSFSRGGARGMAPPVEATGTLISFATKHGNTASDGEGKHSPYTQALISALRNPEGVEIEQLLRKVQQGVRAATGGQQEPWRYGSLDGDFYFKEADTSALLMERKKAEQDAVERAVSSAMAKEKAHAEQERNRLAESLKAQREANDRAVAEAIKAQKDASEKAVAEAVRSANEQAARERAELQSSMERMFREALARQNAALEAERLARGESREVKTDVAVTAPSRAEQTTPQAVQLAALAPSPMAAPAIVPVPVPPANAAQASSLADRPGDEWIYVATDEMFGKRQDLALKIKAVTSEGTLEELLWNGRPAMEWVFGRKAAMIGTPNDAEFMFAPQWDGVEFGELQVEGGGGMCTSVGVKCLIEFKRDGVETLTTAAGTFEAVRLTGKMAIINYVFPPKNGTAFVTVWYSKDKRRLLKQTAQASGGNRFKETLELTAVRRAQ